MAIRTGGESTRRIDAGGGQSRGECCSTGHAAALVRLEMARDRAVRSLHGLSRGDSSRLPPVAELLHPADRDQGRAAHARELHLGLWLERNAAAAVEFAQVRGRGVPVLL